MRPPSLESLQESLDHWMEFLTPDGDQARSAYAAEIISEIQGKLVALESLLRLFDVVGLGLTVRHAQHESWGMLLMDATEPGRFRWQEFKAYGFVSHHTYDTPAECLGDMVDSGYLIHDPDALVRLSSTVEWKRGVEVTAVIQAANARLISWVEANQEIEKINTAYRQKEAA